MKTVLYIDTFSQFGHTNLNKVFLQQFRNRGCKVSVIARHDYIKEIEAFDEEVLLKIPESFYIPAGSIRDRVLQWQILRFIRKKVTLTKYDIIFFSYFDEIVFPFSGIKGNLFFMNHSNVSGLENYIKRFFLRCISRMGTILVFHNMIRDQFIKFGIHNIVVEPLGLSQPYKLKPEKQKKLLKQLDRVLLLDESIQLKVFIPTLSKYKDSFFEKTLSNLSFLNFLAENKILLIIKDKSTLIRHSNVMQLENFLSDETYQAIFLKADFLILHYPKSFQYKISASLFECFSNKKPCLLSNIDAFQIFKSNFSYFPYYSTEEDLKHLLINVLNNKILIQHKPYVGLELLNPQLNNIISSLPSDK